MARGISRKTEILRPKSGAPNTPGVPVPRLHHESAWQLEEASTHGGADYEYTRPKQVKKGGCRGNIRGGEWAA